jgi:hypothetical protein
MSVQLTVLKDPDFGDVDVMAPEYGPERYWLWDDDDNRIDLSRKQAAQLRDWLIENLPL